MVTGRASKSLCEEVGIQIGMLTVYGGFPRAGSPEQSSSHLSSDRSQRLQPEGHKQNQKGWENQNGWEQVPAESVTTAAPALYGLRQEN